MAELGPYPIEQLDPERDDGTMPENVEDLRKSVVGHRIVKAEHNPCEAPDWTSRLMLTLDDGRCVEVVSTDDCCAYTELKAFLLYPDRVDHVVTGVGTTGGYTTWHIYADIGDVLQLTVEWSGGNLGWYGYGFIIRTTEVSP